MHMILLLLCENVKGKQGRQRKIACETEPVIRREMGRLWTIKLSLLQVFLSEHEKIIRLASFNLVLLN